MYTLAACFVGLFVIYVLLVNSPSPSATMAVTVAPQHVTQKAPRHSRQKMQLHEMTNEQTPQAAKPNSNADRRAIGDTLDPSQAQRGQEGDDTDRLHFDQHRRCSTLPLTQALLHDWLEYEAHAALSLMHSIAAAFALLLVRDSNEHMSGSACGLARQPQEVVLRDAVSGLERRVHQSGLFFDESTERFWTMQSESSRPLSHLGHPVAAQPVWLERLNKGDCLVCSSAAQCTGEEEAATQLRKTMAHAPEGWSMVHLHECQDQEAEFRPHKEQRWKTECEQLCTRAYGSTGSDQARDPHSMDWLACQVCNRMDAQVDVAGEVDTKVASTDAISQGGQRDNEQSRRSRSGERSAIDTPATADAMLSKIFQRTQAPAATDLWATSSLAPVLLNDATGVARSHRRRRGALQNSGSGGGGGSGGAVRAFFLDWTTDLAGVSQLIAGALSRPEDLRHMFPDTHADTSAATTPPGGGTQADKSFSLGSLPPFRRGRGEGDANGDADLYDLDAGLIQRSLEAVMAALPAEAADSEEGSESATVVRLGGGGGGGMGLQLLCLRPGQPETQSQARPLLSVGGGGGGGYRSTSTTQAGGSETSHSGSTSTSTFKGGAGGGAGLQSWGVMSGSDGGGGEEGEGTMMTVGGGGGGGIHMRFSHDHSSLRGSESDARRSESESSSELQEEQQLREGTEVTSHSHGASPDDLILLPLSSSAEVGGGQDRDQGAAMSLEQFPHQLAQRMRECLASPGARLVLRGSGGAGGGVKLELASADQAAASEDQQDGREAARPWPSAAATQLSAPRARSWAWQWATTKLRHSVNFKLAYDFSTCGWDRSAAPCAEVKPFPDRSAARRLRNRLQVEKRRATESAAAAATAATLEPGSVGVSPRDSSELWNGDLQRQLADCLAESRELSHQWSEEEGEEEQDEQEEEEEEREGTRARHLPVAAGPDVNAAAASLLATPPPPPRGSATNRKVAFDDLLCTCFFSVFGAEEASPSNRSSTHAAAAQRWMLPSFCDKKKEIEPK